MTRDHQMWRCPRCGKGARPAVPGTHEVVEGVVCLKCGFVDDHRSSALACPACGTPPDGRYVLKRGWNAPTFARRQQGAQNNRMTHLLAAAVFRSNLPTAADRAAYTAWQSTNPWAEMPDLHRMEQETHSLRLRNTHAPDSR